MYKKKYTAAQKRAYAIKMSKARGNRVRGHGSYVVQGPRSGEYIPQQQVAPAVTMTKPEKKKRYQSDWSAPLTGGAIGAGIGSLISPGAGTLLGSALGTAAGGLFRAITGHGDYKIKSNTLVFPKAVPSFGSDCIRVNHREYLCDITSSTAFTNQRFELNPGLATTFPWLSAIAAQYEMYKFNGMIFEYVSTSADALNSTNTALGKVLMATDYNALDSEFTNMQQMMGAEFSNFGKPSDSLIHAIECAPRENPIKLAYVRSGTVPNGADARLYDLGVFQIATQGSQAAANVGSLWVTYDVSFCKPVMNNQVGLALKTDHYTLTAPAVTTSYFGTSRELQAGSNLGSTCTGTVFSFPENMSSGTFEMVYVARGASTAVANPTYTLTNCSLLGNVMGGVASFQSNGGNTTTGYMNVHYIKIDTQGAFVTLSGGTLPGTPTTGDLWITQINGAIVS